VNEWETYIKTIAELFALVSAPLGLWSAILSVRKGRLENAKLERALQVHAAATAAAVASGTTPQLVSVLRDPRARAALRLGMDLVFASTGTLLTVYLLNFLTSSLSTLGREVYFLMQGSIVAILFVPILLAARNLANTLRD
jgi:hypothetical protein